MKMLTYLVLTNKSWVASQTKEALSKFALCDFTHVHTFREVVNTKKIFGSIIVEATLKALGKSIKRKQVSEKGVNRQQAVFLKSKGNVTRFNVEEIRYFEAFGIYSKLYTKKNETLISSSLINLEELLPSNTFMRIHKSYIINLTKITNFDENNFNIHSQAISIGKSY